MSDDGWILCKQRELITGERAELRWTGWNCFADDTKRLSILFGWYQIELSFLFAFSRNFYDPKSIVWCLWNFNAFIFVQFDVNSIFISAYYSPFYDYYYIFRRYFFFAFQMLNVTHTHDVQQQPYTSNDIPTSEKTFPWRPELVANSLKPLKMVLIEVTNVEDEY